MHTFNTLSNTDWIIRLMAEFLAMECLVGLHQKEIPEIIFRAKQNGRAGTEFADLRISEQDDEAFFAALDGLDVGDVETALSDMCAPHNLTKVCQFLAELRIAA